MKWVAQEPASPTSYKTHSQSRTLHHPFQEKAPTREPNFMANISFYPLTNKQP
jgi:hypothetical protein